MGRFKIFCSIIIILFGIILIGYPKISEKIVEKNQIESVKEYDEDILNSEENIKNEEYKKAEKYNQMINGELLNNEELDYNNILNISKNGIMSYINIPKISVNLPIYHGTENEQMKRGVRAYWKIIFANWRKNYTLCFNRSYRSHKSGNFYEAKWNAIWRWGLS